MQVLLDFDNRTVQFVTPFNFDGLYELQRILGEPSDWRCLRPDPTAYTVNGVESTIKTVDSEEYEVI